MSTLTFNAPANKGYLFWAVAFHSGAYSTPAFAWGQPSAASDLLQAVHAHFNNHPALAAKLTGGFWTGEIPETGEDGKASRMPYASVEISGTDYEWTTGDSYLETTRLTFTFLAVGSKTLVEIMRAFEDTYNWETLTIANANFVHCYPVHRKSHSLPDRDRDGELVFAGSIFYEITLERSDP